VVEIFMGMSRFSYKKAVERLTTYAYNEGFKDVIFKGSSSYVTYNDGMYYEPLKLVIEECGTYEEVVYYMLHELGHHELRKDWGKFMSRFPVIAYAEHLRKVKKSRRYLRRNNYLVGTLEEEYKAWDEGLRLAERFGIRVNMKKWSIIKSKCLKAYIVYYATASF
jgi:hypothetical protein